MVVCMMIDTTVDYDHLKLPPNVESSGWIQCKYCLKLTPPRSWHCRICNTCILKRDHHCLFMGCCVGHRNHRFFIMFTLYFFVGAIYAFVYNSYYLWKIVSSILRHRVLLLNVVHPVLVVMALFILNILAIIYSAEVIIDHGPIVLRGGVWYERKKGYIYNAGLRRNMEGILGKRMYLAWLSPLVRSELPDDGITWTKYPASKPSQDNSTN